MKHLAIALAFGLASGVVVGQRQSDTYGLGLRSCGEWTRVSTTATSVARVELTSWVQGFVSAASFYAPDDAPLQTTDLGGVQGFIDKECAENPLDRLDTASAALVEALRIKR